MKNKRSRPYKSGYYIPFDHHIQKVTLRDPGKTIWQAMKDFINNLEIGETFTRQKIIKHVYKTHLDQSTIDTYNNQLKTLGIIEKPYRGRYIKLKRIPETLTTKKLKELTSKKNWRSWFIDTDLIN